jgi:hypothetical protein
VILQKEMNDGLDEEGTTPQVGEIQGDDSHVFISPEVVKQISQTPAIPESILQCSAFVHKGMHKRLE